MASIRMSRELRSRIMGRVGKYLSPAVSYKVKNTITKLFSDKYSTKFRELAVPQIIPQQFLQDRTITIEGYETKEFLTEFSDLTFIIPSIYLPKIPNTTGTTPWGESGWRNEELSLLQLQLNNPLLLPHIHECSRYEDNLKTHHNVLHLTNELIDLFEKFATEADTYMAPLEKHNKMHIQLNLLLQKFYTTKQLTDAWPEIEAFIPPEYLADSIRQKKAKKVPITLEELEQINAISKELLIQKLLKG